MFKRQVPVPRPLGVALDELEAVLLNTNLKPSRHGDSLLVKHESLVTDISVSTPAIEPGEETRARAVVRITTDLTSRADAMGPMGKDPRFWAHANTFASLGSVILDGRRTYIGSRLTICEGENSWPLHLSLILFATIGAADSLLGAVHRSFTNQPPRGGTTEWTEKEFALVETQLSRTCVCTGGGVGLTAEFRLRGDEIAAIAGHRNTALWEISGDASHPEFGGGLVCLLQMPHQVPDEPRLLTLLNQLNQAEMAADDRPPHFGAWCRGRLGGGINPAYVAFLPNVLHSHDGIALNASLWAERRAQIADAMLTASGFRK
jgi:hypothetical protein